MTRIVRRREICVALQSVNTTDDPTIEISSNERRAAAVNHDRSFDCARVFDWEGRGREESFCNTYGEKKKRMRREKSRW